MENTDKKSENENAKKTISYRIPPWLRAAIKEESKRSKKTEAELVSVLMGDYMRKLGYKSPGDELLERLSAPLKKTEVTETEARVAE